MLQGYLLTASHVAISAAVSLVPGMLLVPIAIARGTAMIPIPSTRGAVVVVILVVI